MDGTVLGTKPTSVLLQRRCTTVPFRLRTVGKRRCWALGPLQKTSHHITSESQRQNQLVCKAEAQKAAVFPAGRRQAKVQLPACFVTVEVADVQRKAAVLGAMVSAGVTGVVLMDTTGSGADLYEAGVQLREVLRGRAVLLVADRTDIAAAVEADGVALTGKGVPILVARRMLRSGEGLVARVVSSAEEARTAAVEGANLVILEDASGSVPAEAVRAAKTEQGSSGGIPVVASVRSAGEAAALTSADGVVLGLRQVAENSAADEVRRALETVGRQQTKGIDGRAASSQPQSELREGQRQMNDRLKHFLNESNEALLDAERDFLSTSLAFLQEAAPEMEELGLLTEAVKQLDELFLVVVCGEFNSGKSSIINTLLGSRYLAEGILPTTNEISVLKFSDSGEEESYQNADGFYIRKLPAELLRDINIVDTPGTNVILERQQRLTEEYVPRADLVLFCMSADRPFTESETSFLRYIRQWGKKIVFVVNKVDMLSNDREVEEVVRFVGESATRLLGVERSQVLPVSARNALEAKMTVGGGGMAGSILSSADEAALSGDPQWESSRFGALERFILNFLVGGASAGESVRLKLQTPLFVADALLEAAAQQLGEDLVAAEQDVEAVKSVQGQLEAFRRNMARDSKAQRSECRQLVSGAIKRAQRLVDSTLQLSNLDGLSGYIFGSKSGPGQLPVAAAFEQDVVGPAAGQLEEQVAEHASWLALNCERQYASYRKFAEARAEQLGASFDELMASGGSESDSASASAEERKQWRESRAASQEGTAELVSSGGEGPTTSLAVLKAFDPGAGALTLEEEIRESVINTAGAALGAGVLGIVFTFVLPNTLEDLFAIAIGGLVGYSALLNLPLRRADAKEKLQRAATQFIEEVDEKMQAELEAAVESCIADVNSFIIPLQHRSEAVVARIKSLQERQATVTEELRELQKRAANVE